MGEGWAAARVAEVQSAFVGDLPGVGRLRRYGVRANPSVTAQRATIWTPEAGFTHQGGLTDLEIQAQLERIPAAGNAKDNVYVLFLPDSLAAFLGERLGGGDFLAITTSSAAEMDDSFAMLSSHSGTRENNWRKPPYDRSFKLLSTPMGQGGTEADSIPKRVVH
jgi:hypothetical protein